ncbi:MAG: peptidase M1, partial [Elusimicrobia bacterium]|nr:peptidase M1 [Elusimicrobiota bacterium]
MNRSEREFLGCGRKIAAEGSAPGVQAALLGAPPVYAPDRPFDTRHIYLDLNVDFKSRRLTGFCRTTISARRAGLRSLSFDAIGLKVSKVLFDGKPARFKNADKKLVVTSPRSLVEDQAHDIEVHYSVTNPEAGLHFVKSPEQMWSQSQPEDARRWFPCHDTPGEKATSEVRATVPSGF